jgi:hypothetical protein
MADPEEITFQSPLPHIGRITLLTSEEETKLVFAGTRMSDGAPVRNLSTNRTRRVRREEMLAVRGTVGERLRVAFIEDVTTSEAGGRKDRHVGALSGQTFEIERKTDQGALTVYDVGGGTPALYGVAAQVAGIYRDFGRGDAPQVKLPVGPQRIGKSAPELAESMAAGITRGASITKVEGSDATLTQIRPGPAGALHGLYQLALKVTAESDGSEITLDLKGTILLRDVDGLPLEVRISGPLLSTPDPQAARANVPAGAGEFKMVQTMVYPRA